jgi:hypothetical protein
MNAAMRFVVARVDDFSPEARRIVRSTALRVLVWLAVNGPGAPDSSAALTELPGFSHSCHETTPQGISLNEGSSPVAPASEAPVNAVFRLWNESVVCSVHKRSASVRRKPGKTRAFHSRERTLAQAKDPRSDFSSPDCARGREVVGGHVGGGHVAAR